MRTRNFILTDVIHRPQDFPKELMPIAYTALGVVQTIRDALRIPIIVTSGYREPQYNKLIKGSENSYHMWRIDDKGYMIFALDIASPRMGTLELCDQVAMLINGEVYAHKTRGFVHVAPYGKDEKFAI